MNELSGLYLRYKVVIWPIVVGLASLLVIVLVVVPQLTIYLNLNTQLAQNRATLDTLQAKASTLEQIDKTNYTKNLQLAFSALPVNTDIPQSLNILQTLLTRSGLNLESIKFIPPSDTVKGQNSFQLGLTVLGPIDSLKHFLAGIDSSPRVFKLQIVNSQSVKNATVTETDLVLEVFYQPAPTTLGPVDQPLPKLSDQDQKVLTELAAKTATGLAVSPNTNIPLGKTDPFR